MSLLGIPESDFDRMLKLTQKLFGGDDSEFQRGTTPEEQLMALLDFFGYFSGLTASRRQHPRTTWPPPSPTHGSTGSC